MEIKEIKALHYLLFNYEYIWGVLSVSEDLTLSKFSLWNVLDYEVKSRFQLSMKSDPNLILLSL